MAAVSSTATFTLHWGGEKGGTICQICKKGGKSLSLRKMRQGGGPLPVLAQLGSEITRMSRLPGLRWSREASQSTGIVSSPKAKGDVGEGNGARPAAGTQVAIFVSFHPKGP